jgi:alpha-1,2-mannosyltransferase
MVAALGELRAVTMWNAIKSGRWLTPTRARAYPLILLVTAAVIAGIWVALADGLVDPMGKPVGTDFSNVWAAGKLALEGQPTAPYDPVLQHAAERKAFGGRDVPFFGWHYPPIFLMSAAMLALLPYGWALLAWMALTLPAYLLVIRAIVPRAETLLLALAFPAVFINLGHGQNGFLTAALLGGGLVLIDRRPLAAGALFGLLAYKPQFGIVIPLVLVATGRWRTLAVAALSVLAACALATALFGPEVWTAFADSTAFTKTVVLEAGGTGWEKIQSMFSAVRMWGGGVQTAYLVQATLDVLVAVTLVWLWRTPVAADLKAAALPCACLLTTPYVLDYDLVVVGVSIAFFASFALVRGLQDYEISVLALAWLAPLITRSIGGISGIPLGLASVLALYGLVLRRARTELGYGGAPSRARSA